MDFFTSPPRAGTIGFLYGTVIAVAWAAHPTRGDARGAFCAPSDVQLDRGDGRGGVGLLLEELHELVHARGAERQVVQLYAPDHHRGVSGDGDAPQAAVT